MATDRQGPVSDGTLPDVPDAVLVSEQTGAGGDPFEFDMLDCAWEDDSGYCTCPGQYGRPCVGACEKHKEVEGG